MNGQRIDLVWPDQWHVSGMLGKGFYVANSVTIAGTGIATISCLLAGNYLLAAVLGSFLVMASLLIFSLLWLTRMRKADMAGGAETAVSRAIIPGLWVRSSRRYECAVGGILIAFVPVLLVTPGLAEDFYATREPAGLLAPIVAFFAVNLEYGLVVYILLILSWPIRRQREAGVAISQYGVLVVTRFTSCFFPWPSVFEVYAVPAPIPTAALLLDEPEDRTRHQAENWFSRFDMVRRSVCKMRVGQLTANPVLTYYALRFYQQHPEFRGELQTEAAVDRMRRADYPELVEAIEKRPSWLRD